MVAAGGAYDPSAVAGDRPKILDLVVVDASRERDVPLRVYLPRDGSPAPVVLFSHGLGGSREGNAYLGTHWALRGYMAVFLQHPGSDSSVWRDVPPRQRRSAMEQAAGAQNFLLRVRDVKAVLDQLGRWNESPGHPLARRADVRRVGMSGHSFGAVTTQAVSGQRAPGGLSLTDPRIRAAIVMSPSRPRRGGDAAEAFGSVGIPWLLMTGTKDLAPIGGADLESRLAVFPALPPGGKYELVLDGAEHSAFTDRALPGDTAPRNPNHHRAILALTTAFWDAWLREDPDARRWLDGFGPRSVLESGDRWQRK
jgi:predicted dienelactone hydrolase